MKVLKNKKTGISLVALIVTIIVLIILTGAVIVTFMEDGIVDRAKDAVARNDLATLKEVYSLKYNKKKIDVDIGETEGIAELDALKEATDELKLKGFSYTDGTVTYTGDNKYIDAWIDENFRYKSLSEGGYYFTKIDGKTYMTGVTIRSTTTEWTTAGDILSKLGEGYAIYDNNGTEVTDSSAKVTTGYVIKQGNTEYATIIVKGDIYLDFDIDSADSLEISNICYGAQRTQAQVLASDVNNDGYISKDDANIILSALTGHVVFDRVNIQKSNINKNITIVDEYIYTWYDKKGIETLLKTNGFNANRSAETIEIESGTTYTQLKNDILALFSISEIEIGFCDEEWEDIENLNSEIVQGDWMYISTPIRETDTEFYVGDGIELQVILK